MTFYFSIREGYTVRNARVYACCTAFVLFAVPSTGAGQDPQLLEKAEAYQAWMEDWHTMGYGGVHGTLFTDQSLTTLDRLDGTGDSTSWTGFYLASQAFRYRCTGEPAARVEIERMVETLHVHKVITGTPGYIARYAAPDEPPYNLEYPDTHPAKRHGTGPWEGSFWVGHTSRDQYTGWVLGMWLAWEALEGSPTRQTIVEDFLLMLDTARRNHYVILNEVGLPSEVAPRLGTARALSWNLIAHRISGDPFYLEEYDRLWRRRGWQLPFEMFSFFNKYDEYFGNNLRHANFFPIWGLAPRDDRLRTALAWWNQFARPYFQWTHNPWFDYVHLVGCERLYGCKGPEYRAILEDSRATLHGFRSPPKVIWGAVPPPARLDMFSVWMQRVYWRWPSLREWWDVKVQAKYAYPIEHRCPSDFLWQRSPYQLQCSGENLKMVQPGIDYLLPYWMGRYYGYLNSE